MKQFIVIAFFISSLTLSFGQTPNYLDPSFGDTGTVVMPFEKEVQWGDDKINCLAINSQNKILCGWSNINTSVSLGVIRYNIHGVVDSFFATNGRIYGSSYSELKSASDILLLSDDKFIVLGSRFGAAKFLPNGTPDSSFNHIGKVTPTKLGVGGCYGGALQDDGKILLCGNDNYAAKIVRINANGTIDSSFNEDGIYTERFKGASSDIHNIECLPDGKILVGGIFNDFNIQFFVFRLTSNGYLDSTFEVNGLVITNINGSAFAHDMVVKNDGKIILAGRSVFGGAIMTRYHPNGMLDNTFGNNGIVFTTMPIGDIYPEEIELDDNGKIYLAGHINKGSGIDDDFYLLRYKSDGTVDSSFAKYGIETKFGQEVDRVRDMIIQPDGKILLAGYYGGDVTTFGAMARYLPFPVSVNEINKVAQSIYLYPNPTTSKTIVKNLPLEEGNYYLTDISGKRLLFDHKTLTTDQITIDVAHLPTGIYTFHFLSSDNDHLLKQFLKH